MIESRKGTDQRVYETVETVVSVSTKKPIYSLSLFGYNSGIFHQGSSIFKSKINVIGSVIVLFISIPLIIFKILGLGREVSMSTYFKKVTK